MTYQKPEVTRLDESIKAIQGEKDAVHTDINGQSPSDRLSVAAYQADE